MKPNNHVPASMGAFIDDLARTNKKTENLVVLLAYCIRTLIDTHETIADTHSRRSFGCTTLSDNHQTMDLS